MPTNLQNKMADEARTHILDAAKRIIDSTWRGREHSVEEIVDDIKNFLDEENERIVTEQEWQGILDQFPIVDLSGKILQIRDTFIKKYGIEKGIQKDEKKETEDILLISDDPLEQEQKLIKHLQAIRKKGVKKIVTQYEKMFHNASNRPTDVELIDFIRKNSLERKENRKTVIIALSRIVGSERILRIFDTIEEKRPFDSKRAFFDSWLKKQKSLVEK